MQILRLPRAQRYRASWHKDMAIGSTRDDGNVLQYYDWEYRVTEYAMETKY